MRQSSRSFVDEIDFRTSPGNLGSGAAAAAVREAQGWSGRGPSVVVTDLAVYHFGEDGQMRLDTLHPGASLDDVQAAMGWNVQVAHDLAETPAPSDEELRLIREVLDPEGHYTR